MPRTSAESSCSSMGTIRYSKISSFISNNSSVIFPLLFCKPVCAVIFAFDFSWILFGCRRAIMAVMGWNKFILWSEQLRLIYALGP